MMINEQPTTGTTTTNNNNSTPPLFSSSLDMRIHPLSSSPASNAFFQTSSTLPLNDDVTTIFVVGFPDDMTEREFQNMFMFCRGFEAASLKWHCKDQDDDTSVGSNSGKKQMIGFAKFRTRLEAMEAVEILGGKKVDQDKGTILKAEMAKKNLHVKRGSVAPTVNPLLPSTSLIQQQSASTTSSSLPPLGSPTSSITPPLTAAVVSNGDESTSSPSIKSAAPGTTTADAKDSAVDLATGDVITSLSSPVTSSTPPPPPPPTSMSSNGKQHLVIGEGTMSLLSKKLGRYPTNNNISSSTTNGSYDAFSPLPSDLLSPADYKTDPFLNEQLTCSTPTTPIFSDSLFGNMRSNSFDGRQPDLGLMSPPRHFGNSNENNTSGMTSHGSGSMGFNQQNNGNNSFMLGPSPLAKANHFSSHHPLQQPHPLQQQQQRTPSYPHPLQQQHHHPLQNGPPPPYPVSTTPFNTTNNNNNDDDPFNYLSKSTPVSNDQLFSTSPLFDNLMAPRMGSLTMQATKLTDLRSPSISSIQQPTASFQQQQQQQPSSSSPSSSSVIVPPHHRPSNPADQNPPCNTLYVGNLPPNTNEEELRQLFSQCRGYKRMCFRNKPQGPMCFVEFDDVVLATHALNEHQGHCLTTSIKGGIRLSFSKNPLFIKGPGGGFFAAGGGGGSTNTTTTATTGQQ